jgi:hypothetical protein
VVVNERPWEAVKRVLVIFAVVMSCAAGVPISEVPTVPAASADADGAQPIDPAVERRRQETAAAAVWVVVGIAILGFTMVALVMLLGGHTRRLARLPLPEQTRGDPFWYLRREKERASDANVGEDREAGTTDHRDDD